VVAVVCTLLGSTAFDGLSRTRWWTDLTLDLDFGTADWKMNLVLVSTSAIALFRAAAPCAPSTCCSPPWSSTP
jgi:hypothetical protein